MARRHRPHPPMLSSSSSSPDFEQNIPIMVASSGSHHPLIHAHNSSSFSSGLRRTLLRVQSRIHNNPSVVNTMKWAVIVSMTIIVVILLTGPPRSSLSMRTKDAGQAGFHLRSHHDANDTTKVESRAAEREFLNALYELPLPSTSREELEDVNDEFQDLDPRYILQWAHHHNMLSTTTNIRHPHMHPLVQVTSFGPTGLVILHLLSELKMFSDVPIITMDTLHLFPESYDFYKTIQSYYKPKSMKLTITKPLKIEYLEGMNGEGVIAGNIETRDDFDSAYGKTLWKNDPQRYTKLTKIDPLNKVLDEWQTQVWITGRRRSSGGERADMDVLEFEILDEHNFDDSKPFDTSNGRWKLNPLAYWTYDQVWEYIHKHKLPYNSLYDKGYTSLGDVMTTSLPKPKGESSSVGDALDAFERSGRFVGLNNQTECGLHTHLQKVKKMKQEAVEAGKEFLAPKLKCDKCIELNINNFETEITGRGKKKEDTVLLVEFYSPYCGSCQEFAPTMNHIANHIHNHYNHHMYVARFDITETDIPTINGEDVFSVDATPTLYRVTYTPKLQAEMFYGKHDFDTILKWLKAS